ncbi:hypothetical protein ACHAWF_011932, partial [Thalassiosira exigua]
LSRSTERLTVDQNKQLCKAAKLRHFRIDKRLIDRLLDEPQTSKYAPEGKYVSLNVERIKSMCRERNLQVSGSKFDLVLRILHCDNETTPEGTTLKRAATDVVSSVDAEGNVTEKHVPKKRKKAAPSASRVYNRVQKKIEAVTQKNNDVIRSEEGYLANDPRFALRIAEAACTSLTDNFDTMCRKGYDDFGGWSTIDSSLRRIAEAAKPNLSEEEREDAAEWMEALYHVADPYGLVDGTDIMRTAEFLRGGECSGKSEERETSAESNDHRDPAAAVALQKSEEGTAPGDMAKENVLNSSMVTAK